MPRRCAAARPHARVRVALMKLLKLQRKTILIATSAVAMTLVGVLVAVNFMSGEKKIERRIERHHALDDPRFRHELGVMLGPQFLAGNRARVLRNGDEIFPAMLAAIRSAQTTITFETYIYWSGDIGGEFAQALAERARRGVKVHVLLDWVGSAKMDDSLLKKMTAAGVQIRKYHPPHWSHIGRLNNRTHRKLLVVDGRIAFTGGVGIAPQWSGRAQDPQHWRDTHFQVEGPVVAQMQAVFLDNWIKVSGDVLHGPAYFPQLAPVGNVLAQMFSSSPSGGSESMQLMYLLSISAASRSIDLSAAYFVPDELTSNALVEALRRGVRLRIVVPGPHIDSETVRRASRARWGPLLAAGAVIAEYQPTMYHSKVMVVDRLLVSVGSTNFDNRSFRLNDEATLNIVDAEFAAQQSAIFEYDLGHSRQISLAEWRERPLREQLVERVASLSGSQL
jgi:cardiolipin synthase